MYNRIQQLQNDGAAATSIERLIILSSIVLRVLTVLEQYLTMCVCTEKSES